MENCSFSVSDSPLQSPRQATSPSQQQQQQHQQQLLLLLLEDNNDINKGNFNQRKAVFVDIPEEMKKDQLAESNRNEDALKEIDFFDEAQQKVASPASASASASCCSSAIVSPAITFRADPAINHHPLSEKEYAAARALQELLEMEKYEKEAHCHNMFLEDDDDDEDMERFVQKQKLKREEKKVKMNQVRELQPRSRGGVRGGHESSCTICSTATSTTTTATTGQNGDDTLSKHRNDNNNNNNNNNNSSNDKGAAFLSTTDYSSHPRYGFPCRLDPPIAVREEARCRLILMQHNATSDAAWRQALRGISLLSQADNSVCETLKKLCRKYGCPPHLRSVVWLTMTKVACKIDEHSPQGYGAVLEKTMPSEQVIPQLTRTSIEQDLDRTFPEHDYFRKNSEGHRKLRWILHNLYRRSPINGYCQSFNFIAATFLLVLGGDVEATLWLMVLYFETLLPNDYYNSQLEGVKIDQRVLHDLVRLHIPKIGQHFDQIGYEVGMLVAVWVMSGFTNCFPMETAIAVWDWILGGETREQTPGLLIVALAMLKMHSEEILMTDDPNDTAMLLSQLADITFDWPKLLKHANELALLVSSESVANLRRRHRALFHQDEMRKEAKRVEREAAKKRLDNLKKFGNVSGSPVSPGSSNFFANAAPAPATTTTNAMYPSSSSASASASSLSSAASSSSSARNNQGFVNDSFGTGASGFSGLGAGTDDSMFILSSPNTNNINSNGNSNSISNGAGSSFTSPFLAAVAGGFFGIGANNSSNSTSAVGATKRQRSDTLLVSQAIQARTTFGETVSPSVIVSTVEMTPVINDK